MARSSRSALMCVSKHRRQRAASMRRIGSEVLFLVGHPGLEPGANGLRIHCSTTWANGPFCGIAAAHPEGFEPSTYGFEVRRSIQLSYGCFAPWWRSHFTGRCSKNLSKSGVSDGN